MADQSDQIAALQRELEAFRAHLKEFVSSINHELRTPITSIRGSLGLLIGGSSGELSAEAKDLIEMAERNSVRLVEMISDIVDLYGLESGEATMQLVDGSIEEALSQAVDSVEKLAAERGVTIETTSLDATVAADGDRLQQAIGNVLSNALKVSPKGETVHVRVETDGAWVTIKITDRGRGLPKSHQSGIFDRYRPLEDGTPRPKKGLGLAIARAITERHSGTIGVDSDEGCGSTFWIRLPRSPIPAPRSPIP